MLIAEDSAVNLKLIVRMLEKRGHKVTTSSNGLEAIEAYKKHRFEIILMDVQMPEVDGFEATATIRELEKASGVHVPIVAMTAHAMKGDRERCLGAGMDAYISKPIKAGEVFETMDRIVKNQESQDRGTAVDVEGAVIDYSAAIRHLEGDVDLLKEIAEMFLEESPALMDQMREAASRGDSKTLERAAHTIKGSVGNFAAKPAFEAAQRLEDIGREGKLDDVAEAYSILEREMEMLKPALAALGRDTDEDTDR